jgi:ABC-type uncharacterized transport system permease subunit
VPAKLLAGKLASGFEWLLLAGLSALCYVASEGVWRFSLRHYTSASS